MEKIVCKAEHRLHTILTPVATVSLYTCTCKVVDSIFTGTTILTTSGCTVIYVCGLSKQKAYLIDNAKEK